MIVFEHHPDNDLIHKKMKYPFKNNETKAIFSIRDSLVRIIAIGDLKRNINEAQTQSLTPIDKEIIGAINCFNSSSPSNLIFEDRDCNSYKNKINLVISNVFICFANVLFLLIWIPNESASIGERPLPLVLSNIGKEMKKNKVFNVFSLLIHYQKKLLGDNISLNSKETTIAAQKADHSIHEKKAINEV